jgi:hypothetical protein
VRIPEWIKPGLWGVVLGGAVVAIVGFTSLGWVGPGSAREMATEQADAAVATALTPFCVAMSVSDPDSVTKLAELAALTSAYQRREYVIKAGWTTMPNQDAPAGPALAASCATALGAPPA